MLYTFVHNYYIINAIYYFLYLYLIFLQRDNTKEERHYIHVTMYLRERDALVGSALAGLALRARSPGAPESNEHN